MIIDAILGYVLPFILFFAAFYLTKTFRSAEVEKWVNIAVKAAEQIYQNSGQGKEKFDYVAQWISQKFKIPELELKNIIECAVYELNNSKSKK